MGTAMVGLPRKKSLLIRRQLGTLRRRLARIRVRKQGHQGQMVSGTKQLPDMEVSGLKA